MTILQTKDLRKYYGSGDTLVKALDGVDLNVEDGEFVAIVGTSGSGKSTLLHMLGGLDRPTSGSVTVDGQKIFDLKALAKNNINVDIIIQSVGRDGTKDISFTVSHNNLNDAVELLNSCKEQLGFDHIEYNCDVVKLSVVGSGMMSHPGVAAKMFECLYNENVNINMIATSEIRITVLIPEKDALRAMNAVHDVFGLAE